MPSSEQPAQPRSALRRWFLETETPQQDREGFYENEQAAQTQHHQHPWWQLTQPDEDCRCVSSPTA